MLARPQAKADCNYLSDRVFDGTRKIATADSARLRSRYKDHMARVKKDASHKAQPKKK